MRGLTSFERALESERKSATRILARVAWKVVLYCSTRAAICSLALILLSQTRLIAMLLCLSTSIGRQPCVQTRLDCGSLFCLQASVSSPVFQTRLDCGSLSVYTLQSPALCLKHVGLWLLVCLPSRPHQNEGDT